MQYIQSMIIQRGVLTALAACLCLYGYSADSFGFHLKNASKQELEKSLERRLNLQDHYTHLTKIHIAPSANPRELADGSEKLPKKIKRQIKGSSIYSLLYYDGTKIKYDWRRDDIGEDLPLHGLSMSKSITSYLFGMAYCDRRIHSLDDKIKDYVPELSDTFYGNVRIIDALNMTSGDRVLYPNTGKPAGADWDTYLRPILEGETVVATMRQLGNPKPAKKKKFKYNNASVDAIAMVIKSVSPEGFSDFASKSLSEDAGLVNPSYIYADQSNAPLGFAFYYATRKDWLRIAIRIGEQFHSDGCMGDYLRSALSESVRTYNQDDDVHRYGRYFWSKRKSPKITDLEMRGHGGKRGIIELDKGRVLMVHSITTDYSETKLLKSIFK